MRFIAPRVLYLLIIALPLAAALLIRAAVRRRKELDKVLSPLRDREAAVCMELTKLHERVARGYLKDLATEFKDAKVKGEVALVIAGDNPKFIRSAEET